MYYKLLQYIILPTARLQAILYHTVIPCVWIKMFWKIKKSVKKVYEYGYELSVFR